MKNKKVIAVILSVIMLLSVTPAAVFAAPPVDEDPIYDVILHFGIDEVDNNSIMGAYSDGCWSYLEYPEGTSLPEKILVKHADPDKPLLDTAIETEDMFIWDDGWTYTDFAYYTKSDSEIKSGFFAIGSMMAWAQVDVYAVYDVTYTGADYSHTGAAEACNDIDYVTEITPDDGYKITAYTMTVNGADYGKYTVSDGSTPTAAKLTVPGADIVGDIVINVVTEKIVPQVEPTTAPATEPKEPGKWTLCGWFDEILDCIINFFVSMFSFECDC